MENRLTRPKRGAADDGNCLAHGGTRNIYMEKETNLEVKDAGQGNVSNAANLEQIGRFVRTVFSWACRWKGGHLVLSPGATSCSIPDILQM